METPRLASLRLAPFDRPAGGAGSEFNSSRGHKARIEKLNFNALLHNLILIVADTKCILIKRTVWKVDNAVGHPACPPKELTKRRKLCRAVENFSTSLKICCHIDQ